MAHPIEVRRIEHHRRGWGWWQGGRGWWQRGERSREAPHVVERRGAAVAIEPPKEVQLFGGGVGWLGQVSGGMVRTISLPAHSSVATMQPVRFPGIFVRLV